MKVIHLEGSIGIVQTSITKREHEIHFEDEGWIVSTNI